HSEGTWIGVSDQQRLICLLNGGFKSHDKKPNYRHSRGEVVKDLLVLENIKDAITKYNLSDIEPFTLVIIEWLKSLQFFEFVWDGESKHFSSLPLEPRIWSSSTLYNSKMKAERCSWFNMFKENRTLNPDSLLDFHRNTKKDNKNYGVIMDREHVKTTSITRVFKNEHEIQMDYFNLEDQTHDLKLLSDLASINE
ncbi:MAG: NRDE family protein, partial [Bacteroidia bacterium]|nr:NRDE family protein [Bacteroidia bacterium]